MLFRMAHQQIVCFGFCLLALFVVVFSLCGFCIVHLFSLVYSPATKMRLLTVLLIPFCMLFECFCIYFAICDMFICLLCAISLLIYSFFIYVQYFYCLSHLTNCALFIVYLLQTSLLCVELCTIHCLFTSNITLCVSNCRFWLCCL